LAALQKMGGVFLRERNRQKLPLHLHAGVALRARERPSRSMGP
jgi:hypothetical protein